MKKTKTGEGDSSYQPQNTGSNKRSELKTDLPLSEKDEIKQAEEKMRKAAKKGKN
ncbi:hypothetical protein HDF24_22695 [Mucilaginibacter sp. X4EP1]|uniref:hypothetical protein n=1 Tax=Mucilaginibacter sp. X4EP1 TaxID=2723092 RepID=UPI0021672373|nr:hypothetical protein [Mucilaginibacter sp. X4EP1]MCS3816469.1 hypothetical protein [Mucilaginibacter sp. X4EP1]